MMTVLRDRHRSGTTYGLDETAKTNFAEIKFQNFEIHSTPLQIIMQQENMSDYILLTMHTYHRVALNRIHTALKTFIFTVLKCEFQCICISLVVDLNSTCTIGDTASGPLCGIPQ